MIIKQLTGGTLNNFTYLVGCENTLKALVIDPSADVESVILESRALDLDIRYIINTHGHSDHIAGNKKLKTITNAAIVMHRLDIRKHHEVNIRLDDETEFKLGEIIFHIFHTPGHTPGGICIYGEGQLFTGDTLFVGDSGRTDLSGGDRPELGRSIRKLMTLPDDTVIWPGHDYGPTPSSTIGWEKQHNINAREYGFYVSPAGQQ